MSDSSAILIYFISGLAFFALGLTITLQNRKFNRFLFANSLPLLAAFGITQGITEWVEMFILIRKETLAYTPGLLDNFQLLFLILSLNFLLGFGFELLPSYSKIVKALKWSIPPMLTLGWFVVYFSYLNNPQIHSIGEIWGRYLFGLPGSILAGFGILHNVYKNKKRNKTGVYLRYLLLALSFILYGLFAGLIVPDYPIFPASFFNYSNFTALTQGLPVQLFIGLMAISITIFTVESIAMNETEYRQLNERFEINRSLTFSGSVFTEANIVANQEEVIKLGRMLSYVAGVPVFIISKSHNIIYANGKSEKITGVKKESLLQKNLALLNKSQLKLINPDIFEPLVQTLKSGKNIQKLPIPNNNQLSVSTYLFTTQSGFNKWVLGMYKENSAK